MTHIDRRSWLLLLGLLTVIIIVAVLRDVLEPRHLQLPPAGQIPRLRRDTGVLPLFDRAFRFSQLALPFRARGYVTVVRSLAGITTMMSLGLIVLLLIGERVERMAHVVWLNVGTSFLLGLALVVGSLLLGVLATISLVAAPVVPLIGLALTMLATVGALTVAVALGAACRSLVRGEPGVVADLLTGILVLALALVLPGVGTPLLLLALVWGIGGVVLSRAGTL